ncbi:MAG: hypothetical protein OXG06_00280 [Gammaproteobacteria bacterium]|nr:hypothetical protein [Gammaproteobacteria bacterium]
MLKVEVHKALAAYDLLVTLAQAAAQNPAFYNDPANVQELTAHLLDVKAQLERVDLERSAELAHDLHVVAFVGSELDTSRPGLANEVLARITRMGECIRRELERRTFYCLFPKEAEYITRGERAFGNVPAVIPDACYDLDEAMKCLAFERSTACVFHLMRAMEYAARKAASHLNATVTNKHGEFIGWGPVVSNFRDKAEALPKSDPNREHWVCIAALLYAAKECWRNKAMHIGAKYTLEEAENVTEAVRVFMRQLAERLSADVGGEA